jgi:uncharacterized protein YbcI
MQEDAYRRRDYDWPATPAEATRTSHRAHRRNRARGTSDIGIDMGAAMKSIGEIEAAICEGITRFEQEYMGRGPKQIRAFLLGDLVFVRLIGVLTAAERQLVNSVPPDRGRRLLKEVRAELIETARPVMEAMVREATGVNVLSLHHDISTQTGEEIVVFTLSDTPAATPRNKARA